MKKIKIAVIAIIGFLIVAQAFRIKKTNPPVEGDLQAPPPVEHVLMRSCYNCHSNKTVWPWYSNVAPASWLVAHDVGDGRRHVNFSRWGTYTTAQKAKKLKKIAKEIKEGDMPPLYYVFPEHPQARLSAADRQAIVNWTTSAIAKLAPKPAS
jgi:Haem-binding domain